MSAGEDGGGARAGDALSVRCWVFDRVEEGWPDFVVGSGVCGATPAQEIKSQLFQAIKLFSLYAKCRVARSKLSPVDLNRCDIAVMFQDEGLQSVGLQTAKMFHSHFKIRWKYMQHSLLI